MNNLNRRTKMLVAIAGIVVVLIAVGFVVLGLGDDLFGTTVVHISPENPTMTAGQILGMSVNSLLDCTWTTQNDKIVDFQLSGGNWSTGGISSKSVKVHAVARGQSVITAHCVVGNRSTTVTVN